MDTWLRSVGYPPSFRDIFERFAELELPIHPVGPTTQVQDVFGFADQSQVNVAVSTMHDGSMDATVAVWGKGDVRAAVWQLRPGLAEVTVLDEHSPDTKDAHTITRLLVMVDDPHQYPVHALDAVGAPYTYSHYWLGAVAIEMAVHESEEAWRATQTPVLSREQARERFGPDANEIYIGPRFVTSPWLFEVYGGKCSAAEANPVAILKAVCREVTLVHNGFTGEPWYRVEAACGFPITVALPATITPVPKPGSVLDGDVLLTGTTRFW